MKTEEASSFFASFSRDLFLVVLFFLSFLSFLLPSSSTPSSFSFPSSLPSLYPSFRTHLPLTHSLSISTFNLQVITEFATAKVGIMMVNINPAYRTSELKHALNLVGCKGLIFTPQTRHTNYLAMLKDILPNYETCMSLSSFFLFYFLFLFRLFGLVLDWFCSFFLLPPSPSHYFSFSWFRSTMFGISSKT
jgi:hypothetical protein